MGKGLCSQQVLRHGGIDGMFGEKELFLVEGEFDPLLVNDILLRSVFNPHIAQFQVDFFSQDHIFSVGSPVHDINFSDDSNGSFTLGIDLSGHLETIAGGNIGVGGDDA